MNSYIPVSEPLLKGKEKEYLLKCIETGWISADGPFVQEFEKKFATRMGRKYGIAVCNGTAALETAVAALKLGAGDEVIMPTFTIISCAAAIIRRGCKPVLVDSDPVNWNFDISQIEKRITSRTKAIMVVHTYGLPVDMEYIIELAEKYNLMVIEDAAEMHGQNYKDKPCGSFGNISTFSFYANKHITTGEGGMLLTDDEIIAERCRSLRNLCFKPDRRFIHDELGYNYRMTNLQAALGLAQLEKLDFFIKKKKSMGKKYNELLEGLPQIQLPLDKEEFAENIYWVYGVVLRDSIEFEASEMMEKLSKHKIGTRPFFWPMHEQPVLREMGLFQNETYPVAERLARKGFYLPSGLAITEDQIIYVSKTLRNLLM